jgi:hypothetical protein
MSLYLLSFSASSDDGKVFRFRSNIAPASGPGGSIVRDREYPDETSFRQVLATAVPRLNIDVIVNRTKTERQYNLYEIPIDLSDAHAKLLGWIENPAPITTWLAQGE